MFQNEEVAAEKLCAPPLPTFSDTGVVLERVRGGDRGAFHVLWRRFRPGLEMLIYGRVYRNLNPRLRVHLIQEVEDILAEAMMRAFKGLSTFEYRGSGSFFAWLTRITRNEVKRRVSYWSAKFRNAGEENRTMNGANSSCGGESIPSSEPGPATSADRLERRRRVAEALATLDDRYYKILTLRFFAGAEWKEIAREVGSPSPDAIRMECSLKAMPAFAAAYSKVRRGL